MSNGNDAVISDCGKYRYILTRRIDSITIKVEDDIKPVVFVMLNPSTADAKKDDPTIRRCKGFAEAWGYSHLIVANLYAHRSADPRNLWLAEDPVGPQNDGNLLGLAYKYKDIVCAWGSNATPERVRQFYDMMKANGATLRCLGTTKDGAPRHPLYLRKDTKLEEWSLPDIE